MSKQVKDILETHDTGCPHGITFAIYQDKDECIALFGRSGWPGLKPRFIRWNESVENRTMYHTEEELQDAYVDKVKVVEEDFRIRKLTPRECWRLQGFPDWAFDKAQEVNSNSQLYKQAGNSVTVNVIAAIAKELK